MSGGLYILKDGEIKVTTDTINYFYNQAYEQLLNYPIHKIASFKYIHPCDLRDGCFPPIKKNKNIMTRLSNTLKRILSPNHKLLHKAGFLDSELDITARGREALEGILLAKFEEELVVLAKEKIEEEKDLK